MKLYVTRHGQTQWTVKNIVCGSTDCDLIQSGIDQAKELAEKIEHLGIDVIYTSPLKRAFQTAEILAKALGAPVIKDKRLTEQCYGDYEGGSRDNEEFKQDWQQFPSRLKGGESVFQLVQRVYNFLDEIKAQCQDKTVLIVGHGGVVKVIHSYFYDQSNIEFHSFNMQNCGLEQYEI